MQLTVPSPMLATILLTTVVFPELVPPATPMTIGRIAVLREGCGEVARRRPAWQAPEHDFIGIAERLHEAGRPTT